MSILVVEDDILINEGIKFMLEIEGYEVISAFNIKDGEAVLNRESIELAILDINLPDGSGFEWCKELRERSITTPIVMLTAKDTEEDMVRGLQCGADDYISKPFSIPVLKERIKAVLRRVPLKKENKNIYTYKELEIDFDKMIISKNGQELKITPTEYKIIKMLIDNKGKVLTREQMLDKLWDIDGKFVDENALSVNIRRIRGKLEDKNSDLRYIKTVFGVGYSWEE